MITELTLLKLFADSRESYTHYGSFVKPDALTREAKLILSDIGLYYDDFQEKEYVDVPEFKLWFHQVRHPEMQTEQHEIYTCILDRLETTTVDSDTAFIKKVIDHFKQEVIKEQIQQLIDKNGLPIDRITSLLDRYQVEQEDTEKEFIPCSLDTGRAVGDTADGLRWRLNCLNDCLGPLQPSFTVVAAYVNTGKTSFLASEVAYMAQQITEGSVLWFNNEQQEGFLVHRIWSAVLKSPWDQIIDNYERAEEAYNTKLTGDPDRIRLFDIRGKGLPYIKRMAKKYDAKLVIIDMIDKLSTKTMKNGNMADQLEKLYADVRDFATVTCPVIASSQTDATVVHTDRNTQAVTHQRYIAMHQLKGSHVGKQGTSDAIITIGKDDEYPKTRYISVPKSKTGRECQQEVIFDGKRSLYQ